MARYIVWFEEVSKEDIGLVGGKGANLGEMTRAGFPVPFGFIITSHAYFDFINQAGIEDRIKALLKDINYENPHELTQTSKHIRELILNAKISKKLATEILKHYLELNSKEEQYLKKKLSTSKKILHKIKSVYRLPLVAVRSSATAEDLPTASFAGQQETYLNVKGENNLIQKVKECFASLFTERAIYYRHQQKFDHLKVGLACVVQRMVQSDKSGVAFSVDPVTNDKNKIVIEAVFGLGEYIVQGKLTPDHYEIDKKSFVILDKKTEIQPVKYIKSGTENREVRLGKGEGSLQKLSDTEILRLSLIVADIEKHYYFPQDIEWAQEGKNLYIVQTRPITTLKKQEEKKKPEDEQVTIKTNPILTGSPASPGIAVGQVRIVRSANEITRVKNGDVLVAKQTNPDFVPAMKKAVAIVTEKGGRTSHAAIVSRELGIPAVVGAEGALKILKENNVISVNGATGEIFSGSILKPTKQNGQVEKKEETVHHLRTLTKVYVNLAEPEQAAEIAKRDVDGVGLLRAEFMIADIGTHPKEFIRQKKSNDFVEGLSKKLTVFVKAFDPRPVIYRATDFKTNEYRHLKG